MLGGYSVNRQTKFINYKIIASFYFFYKLHVHLYNDLGTVTWGFCYDKNSIKKQFTCIVLAWMYNVYTNGIIYMGMMAEWLIYSRY